MDENSFPPVPMPEDLYVLEGKIEISFPESYADKAVFQKFIGIAQGNVSFFHAYAEK
jgi:hypothetical protein